MGTDTDDRIAIALATPGTFLNRVATQPIAKLIEAEVPSMTDLLKRDHPTFACVNVSYQKARENKALVEGVLEQVREAWRLANRGDQAWREVLTAVAGKVDPGTAKRFTLMVQHAPR